MIPQKSGEMKKVCTFCISNLESFQDQISSSLEENPQNTQRCPKSVKNTAKLPTWVDIIDIMCFTHYSSHLNTHQVVKKAFFGLTYPQKPLWQKCLFSGAKKWHFRCRNKRNGHHSSMPTSSQISGLHVCFMRLASLGGF